MISANLKSVDTVDTSPDKSNHTLVSIKHKSHSLCNYASCRAQSSYSSNMNGNNRLVPIIFPHQKNRKEKQKRKEMFHAKQTIMHLDIRIVCYLYVYWISFASLRLSHFNANIRNENAYTNESKVVVCTELGTK